MDLTFLKADSRVCKNELHVSLRPQCSVNGSETHADGKQGNGLVNSSQRRHIDSLTTDGTLRSNSSAVFAGTGVDDGINQYLEEEEEFRVLICISRWVTKYT